MPDERKLRMVEAAFTGAAAAGPTVAAGIPPSDTTTIPIGDTEEHRQLTAAANYATALLKREEFASLLAALVAFRRCYVVAYRQLQEQLDACENHPQLVEDLLVGASAYEASKPFDERALMDGLLRTALPWLGGVVDAHVKADQQAALEERERIAALRRETPLPLPFSHHVEEPEAVLRRDRGLILVGEEKALLYLLDKILTTVLAARPVEQDPFTVVRLSNVAPRGEDHRHLIRLGGKAWQGCCDTNDGVSRMMGEFVAAKLSAPPDLLVCDDMTAAHTRSFLGRARGAVAGDAHKRFSRWCEKADCGFVGLVPLEGAFDVRQPEFEQLRAFSHLRGVLLEPGGSGMYKLTMTASGWSEVVPTEVIDAYARRKIIV